MIPEGQKRVRSNVLAAPVGSIAKQALAPDPVELYEGPQDTVQRSGRKTRTIQDLAILGFAGGDGGEHGIVHGRVADMLTAEQELGLVFQGRIGWNVRALKAASGSSSGSTMAW